MPPAGGKTVAIALRGELSCVGLSQEPPAPPYDSRSKRSAGAQTTAHFQRRLTVKEGV
jgi:hypothetical protein